MQEKRKKRLPRGACKRPQRARSMKRPRKEKKSESQSPPRAKPPSVSPVSLRWLTVNGDKVTHGHAYQSKTNPEDCISPPRSTAKFEAAEDGSADLPPISRKNTGAAAHGNATIPPNSCRGCPMSPIRWRNVLAGPEGNLLSTSSMSIRRPTRPARLRQI